MDWSEAPKWVRRLMPWWFLKLLNRNHKYCWSGLVTWKMLDSDSGMIVTRSCFNLSHEDPNFHYDYCGRYETKEEFFKHHPELK